MDPEHVSFTVTHGVVVRDTGVCSPAASVHEEGDFSAFCSSEVTWHCRPGEGR